jgi:hypothetical protein
MRPVILVMLESDGWVIKRGHPQTIRSIHATKNDAVLAATIAANEDERLVVLDDHVNDVTRAPRDEG